MAPEIGFKIQGKFYPWVMLDDWKQKETRAARRVAGCSIRQLLTGGSDNSQINFAFATVAFWRGNPIADEDEIVAIMDNLSSGDLELVGFTAKPEDDAGPPEETPGDDSSESTGQSSESTQEKSHPEASTTRSSRGGSTSGRPSRSRSGQTKT